MAMSRDEIFQEVQEVLVDALGVDNDEVAIEATLMGDLGAESIDFLDIVFRLEKAFGIKIPREELFPAESLMNHPEFIDNGKLTEAGLAELREKMPHTDLAAFPAVMRVLAKNVGAASPVPQVTDGETRPPNDTAPDR